MSDVVDEVGWKDVPSATKQFPPGSQLPPEINQLTPGQKCFLINFAKRLPERNKPALDKACKKMEPPKECPWPGSK